MAFVWLNVLWAVVDVLLLLALARGARFLPAIAIAFGISSVAFLADSGFPPVRFHAMAAASFAIFVHTPLVLLGVAWLERRNNATRAWGCVAIVTALVCVGVDAFAREPHELVTSKFEVKTGSRVRVAVMSDYQVTHMGEYEKSVLARLSALDAELVLLAGDYIQIYGDPRAAVVSDFRQAWQAANIHPRLGVYAVRGDVEPDGWQQEIFGGLDVVTSDETRTVHPGELTLTLLGLRDSANRRLELPAASAGLVLGHHPDFALGAGPPGLLVAGHTHGGQVQLPFWGPPFTLSAVPRAWGGGGLHVVDATRSLLVTRGAGVEHADDAPPLRFNCRPEIVALDLVP